MKSWNQFFIEMAGLVASKSKDPSTKVGCVIVGEGNTVLSVGFNGFARGVNESDPSRWERPAKYNWVCHAEFNAVVNAARNGVRLLGARAYLNWDPAPCEGCAKAFIQAGIVEVIGPDIPFTGVGAGVNYHSDIGAQMLQEAGVTMTPITWPERK